MAFKEGTVSLRIREVMKEKRISSKELSERIGLTPVTISFIINGKTNPSLDTISRMADALEVPIWQLFVAPIDVSPSDFSAFVRSGGVYYHADTLDELEGIVKVLKRGDSKQEAEGSPDSPTS